MQLIICMVTREQRRETMLETRQFIRYAVDRLTQCMYLGMQSGYLDPIGYKLCSHAFLNANNVLESDHELVEKKTKALKRDTLVWSQGSVPYICHVSKYVRLEAYMVLANVHVAL